MGALFIYSGIFKAMDPGNFAKVILRYNVIPDIIAPYAAIILPFIELILGFLVLIGLKVRPSSLVLMNFMIFFIIAITINVVRGESFDCGCFELSRFGIDEKIGISLIIRDIIFFLVLSLLFFARRHLLSLDYLIEKDDLNSLNQN